VFTGIIEEVGRVISAQPRRLVIAASKTLQNMNPGASIAVNGVCLTMTGLTADSFTADVMPETLRRSNLGLLKTGDAANLERPLAFGGQVGGHLVEGHVDDTGRLISSRREEDAVMIRFTAPSQVMRYLVGKGFVAVDGISLTIASLDETSFEVSTVDFTRQNTNLGNRRIGDVVNLEVDILAKYVERLVGKHQPGINADFLREHGFMS
jgi:riboflavin synthase